MASPPGCADRLRGHRRVRQNKAATGALLPRSPA